MRVVLDTNVLVSALHFRSSNARRAVDLVLTGDHRLLTGAALAAELEETLIEVCDWDAAHAHAARLQVEEMAEFVTPASVPSVCRDPDDNEVLAIAEWGEADAIVTGDKDLLVLGAHARTRILTPAQFLALHGGERKSGPDR